MEVVQVQVRKEATRQAVLIHMTILSPLTSLVACDSAIENFNSRGSVPPWSNSIELRRNLGMSKQVRHEQDALSTRMLFDLLHSYFCTLRS